MILTAPRLNYDIISEPFPLLASAESGNPNKARLTVIATNLTGSDVDLRGIILQLPIGAGAGALTNDAALIGTGAPLNWRLSNTQTPTGFVIYTFHPCAGFGTLPKGESLSFALNNIEVNRKFGSFLFQITEGSGDCEPPDCPIFVTHLTKFPNGWGQVSFRARPANIPYQGSTTLHWAGPQRATYKIEYIADGQKVNIPKAGDAPLANQGTYPGVQDPPLSLEATTFFTLNVSQRIDKEELETQEQIIVAVAPPPPPKPKIEKFHGTVAMVGSQLQLTLRWVTERADEVSITHFNGLQERSGELTISPKRREPLHLSYTLKARTGQDAVSSTVHIMWTAARRMEESGTNCAILPDGSRLFLADLPNDFVRVLDPATLKNVSDSPFKVDGPIQAVPSPDSARVYILQLGRAEKLIGYDSQSFRPVTAGISGSIVCLAVTPDNQRLYVSSFVSGTAGVRVYETSNMKLVKTILEDPNAYAMDIAFTPDGSRAFVAKDDGKVYVISTKTFKLETALAVGAQPVGVAVTPDGEQLYVTNFYSQSVSVFDAVHLHELPGSPIPVAGRPAAPIPSRYSKLMFFVTQEPGRLNVIDTTSRALVGSVGISPSPHAMAVSPDGIRIFVSTGVNEMWMFLPAASGGTG